MAIQLSTAVRNAMLDAIETLIGSTSVTVEIRTGSQPANCAAADSGSVVVTITLPADYFNGAASGSKTKLGTWSATATGALSATGHFRLKQSTTCHIQGSVTASGGGGDMTLDNINVAIGQVVTVNTFTLNMPGA